MRTQTTFEILASLLLLGAARSGEGSPSPRWSAPPDWLVSCDGAWVYSSPDLDEPQRAQGCDFIRLAQSGGVVWFHVTVLESTSRSTADLSMGDGFVIEAGDWRLTSSGLVQVSVRPVEHEKVIVKQESKTWTFAPNGRHLIDESHKMYFEPLAVRFPSSHRRLRVGVREWVCGDPRFGPSITMANKALRLTAGCAGRT